MESFFFINQFPFDTLSIQFYTLYPCMEQTLGNLKKIFKVVFFKLIIEESKFIDFVSETQLRKREKSSSVGFLTNPVYRQKTLLC